MKLADVFAGNTGSGVDTGAMLQQLQKAKPASLLTSLGVPGDINDKLAQSKLANFGPGVVSSLANVFTLPHDAAYQQVDPMSPEGVGRAMGWAATMAGGGAATAAEREAGLGIVGSRPPRGYSRDIPPPKTTPLPDVSLLRRPESDWHAHMAYLDAKNAPDEAYRNILSTGAKEMGKNGGPKDALSWRDKIIGFLQSAINRRGQ